METGMNTLQRSYKIYNFTLTVSLHYLIKLRQHKTAHWSQSSQYFITQQQEWVYELSVRLSHRHTLSADVATDQ